MTKQILITFEGKDNVSKVAQNVKKSVESVGAQSTVMGTQLTNSSQIAEKAIQRVGIQSSTMGNAIAKASQKGTKHLTDLGSQLRYMSLVASIAAGGAIALASSFITAAKEAEQAKLKLTFFAVSAGEDIDAVTNAAQKLASTGLVSVTEASGSLANLLATGIGLDKSTKLLNRFLDAASVAKESLQDTLGKALEKASIGFRILQERQVDAIGVNFQLAKDIRETAKSLGLNATALTTAQKQQVLYVYLMKETERYVGAADLATMTFSGSLSKLGASATLMKATLGNTLVPLIGTFATILQKASTWITEFAQAFPGLSSIMLVGTTSTVIFTAALAGLGALLPLLETGMKGLTRIFLFFNATTALMAIKIILITAAIGTLVYLVLRATGQWAKWADAMKNLQKKIIETINPVKKLGTETTKMTEKTLKNIKDIQKNIALATRSYMEDMGEWVKKHTETMSDLKTQITDLEKAYSKSTKKIKEDFSSTMTSLTMDHSRKTEDLQRQIEEEVSKGVWADQTKIRDFRRELKRENEDYALATSEKASTRDTDLKDEKDTYTEKHAKLKEKLDEELAIEQKYAPLIALARTWPILDELAEKTRAHSEKMVMYDEELAELRKLSDTGQLAGDSLGNALTDPIDKTKQLQEELKKANEKAAILSTTAGRLGASFQSVFISVGSSYVTMGEKIYSTLERLWNWAPPGARGETLGDQFAQMGSTIRSLGAPVSDFFKGLMSFQEGGVIPGSPSQPVPIMAHGGETVLPAGVAPITININNPNVRSNADISYIAEMVKQVLVDNQRYRHVM